MNEMPESREFFVVGLDHTPAGSAALRWAVAEAWRRGARVMAVHVYDRARSDLASERDHEGERSRERIEAHRQVIALLGDSAGQQGIALSQLDGPVATRLAEAASQASMLVLGEPTATAHTRLPAILGSTCGCPVMVVAEDGTVTKIEEGASNG